MMAVSPQQLDFRLTCLAWTRGLYEFEALSKLAGKVVGCAKSQTFPGKEDMSSEQLQELVLQALLSHPTQWWDKSWSKSTLPNPDDFKHKTSEVVLWVGNPHKPAWVDPGMRRPPAGQEREALGRLAAQEGFSELGMCRKVCEDGRITDAVNALNLLVQRGRHVPSNLFYRVLKRCVALKDLVLGRHIHVLAIKSGYETDAFLATHLIGLYASHGSLEEAMRVFSKVRTPDAHVWATIIFACARHGEAAQGIRLYQQMCESTVQPDNHIYVAVLKACALARNLVAGKEVHAQILATAGKPDIFVQTGLLVMYAKCGSLEDAHRVFVRLPRRDVVTWNAMISGYAQQGRGQEALDLYKSMQQEGFTSPSSATFVGLLQACASVGVGALHQGKQLHVQMEEQGLQNDVVLGCSLVNMYAKCGSLEDAQSVFDRLPDRNIVTWNAMLAGYAQHGMAQKALSLYSDIQQESLSPNSVTFVCVLLACASAGGGALDQGKQLHAKIQELRLEDDVVLGCSLVNMYAKCGSLEDARRVFDSLRERDVMTWNAILAGYAEQGMSQQALSLYSSMPHEGPSAPNSATFACLLQACSSVGEGALHQGKQIHAQIEARGLQDDVVVGCSLVDMYAKCSSLEDARSVFDRLQERDVVTWTTMIAAYAQQGMAQEALSLHSSMRQKGFSSPDSVMFVCLLKACASVGVGALHQGKQLHAQVEELGLQNDLVVGCSLVNMYAKCGSLEDARSMFDRLPERDIVTWTAMIVGYVQQGMGQEALILYNSMEQEGLFPPDSVTFVCLLQACASVGVGALHQGKLLHAQIEERGLQYDVVLGCSLVNMYTKCSSLEDARNIFDQLPERDVVTWTAMIAGYAQQGSVQEALSLYSRMQHEAPSSANSVTFVCLLQACATVSSLPLGRRLHAEIKEQGMQADGVVGAALVNMYAKCGSMLDSQQVFDSLPERTTEAWSALISGYSHHGNSEVVFELLDTMRLKGIQPNGITFLSVLTVCSHVGLVDKGQKYFEAMSTDYGIRPTLEHYTCMIDLLGRAGHLDEALQMAKTMPSSAHGAVWHTLLGACRNWNNVEIGQHAFQIAVALDGKDGVPYVLMSSIYSRAQMWEEAKEMQARRVKRGAWKKVGQSWWTDMNGEVHSFVVGDKALGVKEPLMPSVTHSCWT